MGYGWAGTCHWRPFVAFIEDETPCTHGNLAMENNKVFSYNRKIAEVDRANKVIYFDDTKISRTTTQHQSAVTRAMYHLSGWTLEKKYF